MEEKSEKLLSFTRHEVIRDIISILKVERFAFNVTILKITDGEMPSFFIVFLIGLKKQHVTFRSRVKILILKTAAMCKKCEM